MLRSRSAIRAKKFGVPVLMLHETKKSMNGKRREILLSAFRISGVFGAG
jgi:hypothetical protein